MMFLTGVNNFIQPRTVQAFQLGGRELVWKSLFQTIYLFCIVLGVVWLVFHFFGGELLGRIYGPPYADAGAVTSILAANVLAVGLAIVGSNGLAAIGRPDGNLWGELGTLLVTLAMLFGNVAGAVITGSMFVKLLNEEAVR